VTKLHREAAAKPLSVFTDTKVVQGGHSQHTTAIAHEQWLSDQMQQLTTAAQHLVQHFQPVRASAVFHHLQPISLQLTDWQHDMHPRAAGSNYKH
jgi:hypothetical protein